MGLAASQARYLTLTARKSDLEFQSQVINTRRIQLAYQTAEIAEKYSEGMNNTRIKISSIDPKDQSTVWDTATFENVQKAGCMVIGVYGQGIKGKNPYRATGEVTDEEVYIPVKGVPKTETEYTALPSGGNATGISQTDYDAKSADDKALYFKGTDNKWYLSSRVNPTPVSGVYKEYNNQVAFKVNKNAGTGSNEYILKNSINKADYEKLSPEMKANFKLETHHNGNYEVNPVYDGQDLQTLLMSGQAQIVTKAFYNYLVNKYGYSWGEGITEEQYNDALSNWSENIGGCNTNGDRSIYSWRSDTTGTFKEKNYTEDDDAVLAEYESATKKIQAQDKVLEIQEKNIETQHKAIETELESIQKVIQNNIEKTFKIFS